ALAESKHLPGVLWAGTDDGLVHISRDSGENWTNITPPEMPDSGTVNILEVSPHTAGRAFISVVRFRLDDFRPYVFRTDDFGENWTLLTDGTNGIPDDQWVRVVREDPDRKGLLYAGTEYGVFVSFDDGAHWQSLQLNFPVAPVTDLVVHEKDLVLSTKGRSFWILDDLSPLHQLTDEVAGSAAHLFAPRDIHRVRTAEEEAVDEYVGGWRSVANPRDLYGGARITRDRQGTDSPNGATIYTWFAETPAGEVTLEILDGAGEVIRRFSNEDDPRDPSVIARPEAPFFKEESTFFNAGLNRFVWDLRHPSAFGGAPLGPLVVPGTYQIRVSTGSWSGTQPIEVLPDPRVTTTAEEFQSQFDLLRKIRDRITDLHRAVAEIRELREGASASVAERLSRIERELVPLAEDYDREDQDYAPKLIQQLDLLYGYVEGADSEPTDSAFERFDDLDPILSGLLEELRGVVESIGN
ncbi:MAG: glycosyl hydrolase, partial [Acidobacteriota bacterium]|nr:glycosyl hydrolase [Acidobacteriota bacterium]